MRALCKADTGSARLIEQERKRGDCYRLLAACFYLPERTVLREKNVLGNLSAILRDICPDASVYAGAMDKALEGLGDEELAVEYARLFVGPFELQAPPYGSFYMENEKRLMGDSTIEAVRIYEEEGLVIDKDFKELPDHITVELEFMYYLCYKKAGALTAMDMEAAKAFHARQQSFQKKFIAKWVPLFCEKIKTGTDNPFYVSLAECLSVLVSGCAIRDIPETYGE